MRDEERGMKEGKLVRVLPVLDKEPLEERWYHPSSQRALGIILTKEVRMEMGFCDRILAEEGWDSLIKKAILGGTFWWSEEEEHRRLRESAERLERFRAACQEG